MYNTKQSIHSDSEGKSKNEPRGSGGRRERAINKVNPDPPDGNGSGNGDYSITTTHSPTPTPSSNSPALLRHHIDLALHCSSTDTDSNLYSPAWKADQTYLLRRSTVVQSKSLPSGTSDAEPTRSEPYHWPCVPISLLDRNSHEFALLDRSLCICCAVLLRSLVRRSPE